MGVGNMGKSPLLSRIVTSPFFIVENPDNAKMDDISELRRLVELLNQRKLLPHEMYNIKAGLNLLASQLVRSAAHKIFIPECVLTGLPRVTKILKDCSPSFAQKRARGRACNSPKISLRKNVTNILRTLSRDLDMLAL